MKKTTNNIGLTPEQITIGALVNYYSVFDKETGKHNDPIETKITSDCRMCGDEWICKVEGISGGVFISHLELRNTELVTKMSRNPNKITTAISPDEVLQYTAVISNKTDKGQLFFCNTHFLFLKLKGIVKPFNNRRYQCRGEVFECLIDDIRDVKGEYCGDDDIRKDGFKILQKLTEQEINEIVITEDED